MFLRIAVTYVTVYALFYVILGLYEYFIKKFDITNTQRFLYVAGASAVFPITIVGAIIFVITKLVNGAKKF